MHTNPSSKIKQNSEIDIAFNLALGEVPLRFRREASHRRAGTNLARRVTHPVKEASLTAIDCDRP
jgi:hypothetical protein